MEIALSYYPLFHNSPIKSNSLAVLKLSGHSTQKFGFVGSDGELKCYRFDKNIPSLRYKSESSSGCPECVIGNDDCFILSQRKMIHHINRKGEVTKKIPIAFENSISFMIINGGNLIISSGKQVITVGLNNSGLNFPNQIIGLAVCNKVTYIGLANGEIHTYVAGTSQEIHQLNNGISLIESYSRNDGNQYLVVGTQDCKLTFFDNLDKEASSFQLPSPATSLCEIDVDKNGSKELLVSLENGSVCLISMSIFDSPKVINSISIGFSATNIKCGLIYGPNLVSAIVTSQSGHVGILSVEPRVDKSLLTSIAPKVTQSEIDSLKFDVELLESQSKSTVLRNNPIVIQTKIDIKSDPTTQRFVCFVEAERPISRIAISSTIPISYYARSDSQCMISEAKRKKPISSAIIIPVDTTSLRASFEFSYEIGQGGDFHIFVNYVGSSYVHSREFSLKPFGLLKKMLSNPHADIKDESLSVLVVSSVGSSSVFHSVINNFLPSVLDEGLPVSYSYGCISAPITFIYENEHFYAKSVFFPLIIQIRNYIIESMNELKQQITFDTKIGQNCIHMFFNQIQERLFEVNATASRFLKLTALREVLNSSSKFSFSDDESGMIMKDSNEIIHMYEECKEEFDSYHTMIKQFYIEMWKKDNIGTTEKMEELCSLIKDVRNIDSLKLLIQFMNTIPK